MNDGKSKSPLGDLGVKHINIKITGKVQGVNFRAVTKIIADQMGVRGLVKNEADGSVYVEAEGEDVLLEEFINWCHEGTDRAMVEKVEVTEGEVKNYRNFEVLKK